MTTCKFNRAWRGPCGEPTLGEDYCDSHLEMWCISCGEQATRECDHTGIQFVCGYPLCDACTHGNPAGTFLGLGGGHSKKEIAPDATTPPDPQQYLPGGQE